MDKKENTQNNTDSSKIDPVTEGNQTASTISDENSADGVVFDKKSTIITPTKKDKVIQPTPTIPTKETDIGELNIADEEKIKTINLNSGEIEGVENIVPPIKSEQEVQKVIDVTEEGIVESTESVNKKLSEEQNPKEKISNIFSEKKPAEGELKKETHENTTINKADRTEETPLKTVRTFKEDIAKALKESKASITGIALAGKTKRSKEKTTPTKKKSTNRSLLFGFGAVVVAFLIASGIFFFLTQDSENTSKQITELKIPTLIFPNYQKEIHLTSLKRNKINASIENQKEEVSIPLGQIIQFYLTNKDNSEQYFIEKTDGFKLLVTSQAFFETLDSDAPDSFTRTLEPDMMFGFHSSLGNNPFLIMKINSFETAFAGMLEWEKDILDDIFPIFRKEVSKIDISTNPKFEDIVISNKDVRAILNDEGGLEFAYSFADKDTLIMINNETTLQEIFRRLRTSKLERSS